MPSDLAVKTYYQLFDSLIIDNDVMYKIFYDDRGRVQYHQLLIPESMRASFLELCHNDALCHALTMSKNQAAVQRRGYWPGWKISVKVFVKNCRRCAEYHRGAPPKQGCLHPSGGLVGAPGERLSIDLTGRHVSSNGFCYVLTCQDVFSKFITLTALRDKSAQTVARALVHSVFLKHGAYNECISDLGSEFINAIQDELCEYFGTRKLRTIAYKPSSNPVERCHKDINSMLGKLIDNHSTWSEYLDYVAFAFNSTTHKST